VRLIGHPVPNVYLPLAAAWPALLGRKEGSSLATQKIVGIHYLRGVAAALVVVWHVLGIFWYYKDAVPGIVGLPATPGSNTIAGAVVSNTIIWGGLGVSVFFLISGFVIPLSLARYDRSRFLLARAVRILPTYWVCLAVSLATLFAVATWWGGSVRPTLGNVLVQGLLVRQWTSYGTIDAISWTLEIEVSFYVLCAVFSRALIRLDLRRVLQLAMGVMAVCLIAKGYEHERLPAQVKALCGVVSLNAYMIYWMLIGVLFFFHHRKALSTTKLFAAIAMLLVPFIAFMEKTIGSSLLITYLVGLMAFSGVYFVKDAIWHSAILQFLGDISYPLYAVHSVVSYALQILLNRAGVNHGVSIWVTFAVVVLLAWLVHRGIERPSIAGSDALKLKTAR
jgi:peptidoglycan/LPS O-acetylase OafA/YrhL